MTISQWLKQANKKLESASVPTARLDTEVLLAEVLKKDRSWLHAHSDFNLQRSDLHRLDAQVERRAQHEPLAYIRGRSEFYGRRFFVTPDTLQPRPETETMITVLKELSPLKIVDIGTGSGCIAITAKLELPASEVLASDISDECLKVAKRNAKNLSAEVTFMKSDLLLDLPTKHLSESILCCNLPYVPTDFAINTAASHEPDIALFGGQDGLDYYRQLFEQIISLPPRYRPQAILTESMPPQHVGITAIAKQANYGLAITKDFIQLLVIAPVTE